jgi:hypothetical protein
VTTPVRVTFIVAENGELSVKYGADNAVVETRPEGSVRP